MNFHAFRSAARVYFADEANDDPGITEDSTIPRLRPYDPIARKVDLNLSGLARETVFNTRTGSSRRMQFERLETSRKR